MTTDLSGRETGLKGCCSAQAVPKEFREDVVRVARARDPKTTLEQIAKDIGIHATTLTGWMRKADVEDGVKPGTTEDQNTEFRELKRRNRLLDICLPMLRCRQRLPVCDPVAAKRVGDQYPRPTAVFLRNFCEETGCGPTVDGGLIMVLAHFP